MDVLGLRSTEIDGLFDWEENQFMPVDGNELGLFREYTCKYLCDLVRLDGAQALMTYGSDFYQGYPALTVNSYGKGSAWYVAADAEQVFQEDFIAKLLEHEEICGAVPGEIPEGLEVTTRETEDVRYYIYQNFGTGRVMLPLPEGETETVFGDPKQELEPYGLVVLRQRR